MLSRCSGNRANELEPSSFCNADCKPPTVVIWYTTVDWEWQGGECDKLAYSGRRQRHEHDAEQAGCNDEGGQSVFNGEVRMSLQFVAFTSKLCPVRPACWQSHLEL